MDIELTNYLETINFDKQLTRLCKKLNSKKIIIYGCGQFFQIIHKNYELSKLNIIGISDIRFTKDDENNEFLGYKIIPKSEIPNYNPDYILIATLNYINIIKNFEYPLKLKPLVQRPFLQVLKEIWCK